MTDPDGLRVRRDFVVPPDELRWRFSRSGGPGGQSVNTSDSRVELRFDIVGSRAVPARLRDRMLFRLEKQLNSGVLTVVASEHRSQLRNRQVALGRLAATLRSASEPPRPERRATRPSRGAVERRLAEKKRRGDVKRHRGRPDE